MKKGLKTAQHDGSVRVKFSVSKDVASHIQQSVVSNWKRMQDIGVVAIQLDREQLVSVNSGPYAELSSTQSIERQRCTQLTYPFSGCADSKPEHDFCYSYRNTRGRKRSRAAGSQATKRRRNDGLACQRTDSDLCSSTASVAPMAQERMSSRIEDNTSHGHGCIQDQGTANLRSIKHVSKVSSSQLPRHMTSDITVKSVTALGTVSSALPAESPFTANVLPFKPGTANAVNSRDLPPPSTPYVPKRRKRRKLAGGSSEAVLEQLPLCTKVDHTTVPVRVNGGIDVPAKLCWPNYSNWRFQLNGHYPPQFNSAVFSQYAVDNARLMPHSYASPHSHVALANCTKLPAGRHLVLDSCLPVSPFNHSEPENFGVMSVKGNVPASNSHLLQPLVGSSFSSPAQKQCGLLRHSVVPASSEACRPKLSSGFSQGSLELRRRNPETYGTAAEAKDSDCVERSCRNVNDQLCDVLTERYLCSQISTSDSTVAVKPTKTMSSLPLFSEVNSLQSSAPVRKSSDTVGNGSVENIPCSVASTASVVCSASNSTDIIIHSETVDSNLPASRSAVVKKRKSDTMNGYHVMSDYTQMESWRTSHKLESSSVAKIVCKPGFCLSTAVSNDVNSRYELQTAVDNSAITEPALSKEVTQVANMEHSVNTQSHYEPAQSASSISRNISG